MVGVGGRHAVQHWSRGRLAPRVLIPTPYPCPDPPVEDWPGQGLLATVVLIKDLRNFFRPGPKKTLVSPGEPRPWLLSCLQLTEKPWVGHCTVALPKDSWNKITDFSTVEGWSRVPLP